MGKRLQHAASGEQISVQLTHTAHFFLMGCTVKQTQSALRKILCVVNTVDILASLKVFGKKTFVVLMLVRVVIVDMSDFYSKGHRQ